MSLNSNTQELNTILDTMNNLPLGGGGLRTIGEMIDESGLLDNSNRTIEEKVIQLINKARVFDLCYTANFGRNGPFPVDSITVDCKNLSSLYRTFYNLNQMHSIYVSNTGHIRDWTQAFEGGNIQTIETLDLTSASSSISNKNWMIPANLKNLKIVSNSIKVNISLANCSLLTSESIWSIINGLSPVEITQTLTLHANVVLTDEQKTAINEKGWTLVQ